MKKFLSTKDKNTLAVSLLESSKDGKLPPRKVVEASAAYEIGQRTIHLIWAEVRRRHSEGLPITFDANKRFKKITVAFDEELMKSIPFRKRTTIRNLAQEMGVSKSTIGRWKDSGVFRAHTNAIKPTLNFSNEIARLRYFLDAIMFDRRLCKTIFKPMRNVVHADEKWFNLTKENVRYYICPDEEEPHRTCQNKRFITKVMFFCAVSRPIFAENGDIIFDGKIGMWPFTKTEPAKRKSQNRAAETMITKPLQGVNKEVTKAMLINHVIPAIKSKWPAHLSKDIIIQWDNAPPHIKNDDPDFRKAACSDGFNINIVFQPPNSPDTNINDLGWFRSIESIKVDRQLKTVDDLVEGVQESFSMLCPRVLNKVFLSLQNCIKKIMEHKGKNCFKTPHQGKDALERRGLLPADNDIEAKLVKQTIMHLMELGHATGYEGMMAAINL